MTDKPPSQSWKRVHPNDVQETIAHINAAGGRVIQVVPFSDSWSVGLLIDLPAPTAPEKS